MFDIELIVQDFLGQEAVWGNNIKNNPWISIYTCYEWFEEPIKDFDMEWVD